MKNLMKALLLLTMMSVFAGSARASDYVFSTTFLNTLEHSYAYEWGLQLGTRDAGKMQKELKNGQVITSAVLTFKNIYNWKANEDDFLYVDLLDDPANLTSKQLNQFLGVHSYCDTTRKNPSGKGDYFGNNGNIGIWSDPEGGRPRNFDLVFTFSQPLRAQLTKYLSDGIFGFGIDPDCHYSDCRVSFSFTTGYAPAPVPEPCTMALFGVGLLAPFILKRKFVAKK